MKNKYIIILFIFIFTKIYADWQIGDGVNISVNIPILEEYIKIEWHKNLDFNLNGIYAFSGLYGINNIANYNDLLFISAKNHLFIIKNNYIKDSINIPLGAKAVKIKNKLFYIHNNILVNAYKDKKDILTNVKKDAVILTNGKDVFIYQEKTLFVLKNKKLKMIKENCEFPVINNKNILFMKKEKNYIGIIKLDDLFIIAKRDGLYFIRKIVDNKENIILPYGGTFVINNDKLYIKDINSEYYSLTGNKIKINDYIEINKINRNADTMFLNKDTLVIPLLKEAVEYKDKIYVLLWNGILYEYKNGYFEIINKKYNKFSGNSLIYYPVYTEEGKNMLSYIGEKISNANPKYLDEIYYTLSYLPLRVIQAMFRLNCLDIIFDNPYYIYNISDSLRYVNIKENGNFTTLVYSDSIEIPDSIYYSCVVMPMIIHEIPAYIDTSVINNFSDINDTTNFYTGKGVFWRDYFTKDKSYDKSFYDIVKNETSIDSVVHKIHRFTNHKTGFMDFGYKTKDIQPVVIYKKHYGSCGEHSAFSTAILRSLLIPAWTTGSHGEDHVWAEYYNNGKWIHWDLAFDENKAFDNPIGEDMSGKGITVIYAFRNPGNIIDRTEYYREREKIIIKNFEGNRAYLYSNWNNSKSLAYWKELENIDTLYTGFQKKGLFLSIDNKDFYIIIDTSKTINIINDENKKYEKNYYLNFCPVTRNFVVNKFLKDSIGYIGTELILLNGYTDYPIKYFNKKRKINIVKREKYTIEDTLQFTIEENENGSEYAKIIIDNKYYFPISDIFNLPIINIGNGRKNIKTDNDTFNINVSFTSLHKRIKIGQDNPEDPFAAKMILGPFDVNDGMIFVKTENGIANNDLDIFLIKDIDNNNKIDKYNDKKIAISTSPIDNETIGEYVKKGKYFVIIQGWYVDNYDEVDLWLLIENPNN